MIEKRRFFTRIVTWFAHVAGVTMTVVAAASADPVLELPVDCDMETVCTIQKYMDHDPGPGRRDYACGRLSKDGDTGTDFRTPDYPTMARGIAVVAAAAGVVRATRDGMADVSVRDIGPESIKGREAGNAVVVTHGDGWETQYSHLKKGSVTVRKGDTVTAGQKLGLMGLSGNTEFPHVEFSVRYEGKSIDPFVGRVPFTSCDDDRSPLWSDTALAQLAYRPTRLLTAGFATSKPQAEAARHGAYFKDTPTIASDSLVMWVDISGAMKGDEQTFRIEGPNGRVVHESQSMLEANNISWFAYAGRRRPEGGWVPGRYRGTYTLTRGGQVVVSESREVTLE